MKFTIVAALFAFLDVCMASLGAGPYQMVFGFYAYRITVIAAPKDGNGKIDPTKLHISGCAGTMPDGSCTFDEFVKKVQYVNMNRNPKNPDAYSPPWDGKSSVGTNTQPDPDAVVKEMESLKVKMQADVSKLIPSKGWGTKGVPNPSFRDMMSEMVNTVQDARTALGSDDKVKVELDKMDQVIDTVRNYRRKENAAGREKWLQDWFTKTKLGKNNPTALSTDKVTLPDGDTFEEINWNHTFEDTTKMGVDPKFVTEVQTQDHAYLADKKGKSHQTAIDDCDDIRSTLKSGCGKLQPRPKTTRK
ncbi:hypothetical protein GQ53DRAFT_882936 [Thozetella sp. PMI_491]|nr:hypothetical protein GQ53DRAFT_882936 [Thozetella sp. PMI_491]